MFPYLAMIGLPALFCLPGDRRFQTGTLLFAVLVLFVCVIGFRYEVGSDWFSYRQMIESYQDQDFDVLAERGEVGWVLLVMAANMTSFPMPLIVFIAAVVFGIGLFAVARMTQEPMLAVVASTPYLALAVAMSGVRQSIALGIIFLVIANWHRLTPLYKVPMILFASLFHFSAISMILFVVLDARLSKTRRIIVGTFATAIVGYALMDQSFRVDRYSSAYLVGEEVIDAPGAILHVALIAVPAIIYLVIRREWNKVYRPSSALDLFALVSAVALAGVIVAPAATDRMSLYFSPAAMIIQAGLPMTRSDRGTQMLWRAGLVLLNLAAMLTFLLGANHSRTFIPYQSIFSEGAQLGISRR